MEVVSYLISMVKKNTKGLCKEAIEKLTKDWPGGSYLVLSINPMVPGGRIIFSTGYKYNVQKVLSFIAIDNAGITQAVFPYLYK